MPMNTQQFENLWTRKIDKLFFESWDEEKEQWSRYLQNEKSNRNNHTTQIVAGSDTWTKRAQENVNATEKRFKQGPLIIKEYDAFDVEVVMSREQIDDESYGEVEGMVRDQGHAGRETVERESVSVLDDAFTVAQYDGKALCANDHPNYGDQGGTQSNLATGALTDTNLRAGIILFRDQKDEGGKQIMARPNKLVINQSQQFTAAVILQSSQVSGTANNDKNPLPSMEIVDLDFLASGTSWFLQGPRHQLLHIWRVMPEFKKKPFMEDNMSVKWLGYFRHATKIDNWRQIIGSTGV